MNGHERIDVIAEDGSYVGRLRHVAAEHGSGRATGLVLERNGNAVVVPIRAVRQAPGDRVILVGTADDYDDLPPFNRAAYVLLDREYERAEVQKVMERHGVEDFQIGSDDADLPTEREVHTGAENPFRAPVQQPSDHPAPIADDATDLNERNEEMRERTRSDMH